MDAFAQIRDWDALHTESGNWRMTMMLLTPFVRPVREDIGRTLVDGARRARTLYDATAIVANNNLGSAVYGSTSNPADQWFEIGTDDPEFNKWPKVRSVLDKFSRRTLQSYSPTYSAFYGQTFPLYLDIAGLGMGFFYQEERFGPDGRIDGFTDKCIPLSECEFRIDDEQRVTHFYRRFKVTLEEADKMAKLRGGQLSDKYQKLLEKEPHRRIELQHSVFPNPDFKPGMLGSNHAPFASCWLIVDEKFEMARKGYDRMPFYAPAWERAAGERHGRGAGEMALADIMSLQVMQRENLTSGSWQANPMWGLPHDANVQMARARPGAIMPGAVTMQGAEILRRLGGQGAGGTPFSLDMADQLRNAIKDAFEGSIINIIQPNRSGATPTEALDIREERFRRMAPYQGNITCGCLDPHVRQRFSLLNKRGVFDDLQIPKDLLAREIKPIFKSPMALAQAAARASSATRAVSAMAEAAQLDPSVADRFNGDAYAKLVGEGYGVGCILNDDDATQARAQARAQAQQQQMQAELADTAAGAAQKGAGAMALMRGKQPGA